VLIRTRKCGWTAAVHQIFFPDRPTAIGKSGDIRLDVAFQQAIGRSSSTTSWRAALAPAQARRKNRSSGNSRSSQSCG